MIEIKKYLDNDLAKIYEDIEKIRIVNVKKEELEPEVEKWFYGYLKVFDKLVKEYNPKKIKETSIIKENELNQPSVYKLFKSSDPVKIKNAFDKSSLDYNIFVKSLENINKFANWINQNNRQIYNPPTGLIYLLEQEELDKLVEELDQYNEFMSFQIQREIKKGFKYQYHINDPDISIVVESKNKIPVDSNYFRFLYARGKSVKKYYNGDRKIHFKIYLTNQKKELPDEKKSVFGSKEINSGSTDYQTIQIWRKEEHYKLILHESIHFYNLDGSYNLFEENNKINLECHYQIERDTETRIFESYTEALTSFLNTFANSYQIYYLHLNSKGSRQIKKEDYQIIKNIYQELWKFERKFALIQIAKIHLHVFPRSSNFNDFIINPRECDKRRLQIKEKLKQNTSVLSYHILKGAVLFYDQKFINWIPDLKKPRPSSLRKFVDFLVGLTHNKSFIDQINSIIKQLKNIKYDKNLRMTFYETKTI